MLDLEFQSLPTWAKRLAVFDLETTGLDLSTARIVTACVAVIDANGQVIEQREWLVNPGSVGHLQDRGHRQQPGQGHPNADQHAHDGQERDLQPRRR